MPLTRKQVQYIKENINRNCVHGNNILSKKDKEGIEYFYNEYIKFYSFIPNNIEKIIIEMGDWWEIKITDRKEIYVNTGELKERIRQKIEDKRKRDNERIKERLFLQEIEERKKREFQENFDKLTPEMKAFFYVATALGREYLQACKNQNSYTVQNPYYHNNLLDNFLL